MPSKLSLGSEDQAEISVEAPESGVVRFFANIGEVSDVRRKGGRIVATYHVPKERYPQVAIIVAASSDLSVVDWGSIALHGRPTVKIRYGRRANVMVRAGDKEFGPVQTDRRGRAELVVEVAPGVQSVTVYGADRQGATKERVNPLEVPSFARVFVMCSDAKRVLAFAVDETGKPLRDLVLPIDAVVGTRTQHQRLESGATFASFDVSADELPSFAVQSTAPGGESPFRCEPPEVASGFEIEMADAHQAGEGPVEVKVRPTFAGGQAPSGQSAPKLEVDFGKMSTPQFDNGVFVSQWTIPDAFEQRAHATLVVSRPDGGAASTRKLTLRGAPATALDVSVDDDSLIASASSQTSLRVRFVDAYGNTVHEKADFVVTSAGETTALVQQSDGQYVAAYSPLGLQNGQTDTIRIHDKKSDLRAEIGIELRADSASALLAVRVGYLTNFEKVSGPVALLGLRYRLPLLDELPIVGLDIGGFLSSCSELDSQGIETVEADLVGLPMLLRFGLNLPLGSVALYAVAAGGVLWSSADVQSQSSGRLVEDDLTFAIGGFAGAEISVGPGAIVLEAGYLLAPRGGTLGGHGMGLVADIGYGIAF